MNTTLKYRFAKPVTLEYLNDKAKKDSMPVITRQQAVLPTDFVICPRRKDGKPYPASTSKHILAGIQRHLRNESNVKINFFKDPSFSLLRMDSRMKDLRSEKKNRNFCKNFQLQVRGVYFRLTKIETS